MVSGFARAAAIARAAWQEDWARPKAAARHRHELEFLPAALEVTETPASPAGRAMTWLIIGVFTAAVAWAYVGKVDVVAVAQGKVVSTGRSKVVQPFETGIISAIRVHDGQAVKAGDVLIELDPTGAAADRERLLAELTAARVEAVRLEAELMPDPAKAFAVPDAGHARLIDTQRALLVSEIAAHRAKIAGLDQEIAQKRADRVGIEASIVKLEKTIPLAKEQADARSQLASKGYFPRLIALDSLQKVIEQEQDLESLKARRLESDAAIVSLEDQRAQAEAQFAKEVLDRLADANRRIASTTQDLLKADQRRSQHTLSAPIDGVVQQLEVHTVGGVVTPAQQLMVVVPKDDALEIEAKVMNHDVGFVQPGQEAEVKIDTFQFTKYGTIPGRVISVSADSVKDEKLGFIYPARVALSRTAVDVDGRSIPLEAGMAASAEIKTDRRRVLEYLLSPILRYRHDSLRER
jgi:hemolysin D